jgi:hypothetical protein
MSISYNYFLPTNIYGTLRVTDLGFSGYTAVNANIYCQRNINSDGQMQCGSFKSLGASVFDQVPTCTTNATTATQLTNYQTVQDLIESTGGVTLQEAIDGVHASSSQFTVPQNIWNTLTFRAVGGSMSTTNFQHSDTLGTFIFTNTSSTGHYRFNLNTTGTQSSVLEMDSTLFLVRSGNVQLNLTTVNALTCSNNASFNGSYPTTTLGSNSGLNNNEFATVGYAKSIGGTSILGLNNTFTGTNTFSIPIISSGASLTSNTIPALSIVNNSLTNSQIATGFQLVNENSQTFIGVKTFSSIPILPSGYEFLTTGTQAITGEKQFNTNIPTTTLTPSTSTQFATVGYVNSAIPPSLLGQNNTWTGTNTFNSSIPTTTLTPSTSTQFATVGYVTGAIPASLLGQNNTWTGTNTFNSSIPTTTLTPTTSTQLTPKSYVDANSGTALLASNNIWTGTNRFDNTVTLKGQVLIPDQTTTVGANCNINILGQTIGNYINWYQNGLSDSVSAGYDAFNQLNYDIYPFSTTSNISCRIGTVANAFKSLVLNGNVTVTPQGQISQPVGTIYSTGVTTTFTTIPPYILFDPKSGMSFVLPVPGPLTAGQIFVIRKVAAGSTISFTVPGNLPVWVPLNAAISAGLTALSISTIWQFTILSTINAYITIA